MITVTIIIIYMNHTHKQLMMLVEFIIDFKIIIFKPKKILFLFDILKNPVFI